MNRVFIGFDPAETVAYTVAQHSILRYAREPVAIIPLASHVLLNYFFRKWDAKQSNDFAFTRWLVPFLCEFKGKALYIDCDMLCRAPIDELFRRHVDYSKAVSVVKHDYIPNEEKKYLGRPQTIYTRKNWSSVMLFNCEHADCKALTPEYVQAAPGLDLHQFQWTDNVGELSPEWNHLVGVYNKNKDAKLVHYTIGGPYFNEYLNCEFSSAWWSEWNRANHCRQREGM